MREAQELAEIEAEKGDQVLEREPKEQELMQEGASEVGETIDDVEAGRNRDGE